MSRLELPPMLVGGEVRLSVNPESDQSFWQGFLDVLHRHSLLVFAVLLLIIGLSGIEVGGSYYSARKISSVKPAVQIKAVAPTIAGLNLSVPADQLQAKLQTITNQPAKLTVDSQTVTIPPATIKSWLQITSSTDKTQDYIRVNADAMASSLQSLAGQFVKAPVNQVTATAADGTQTVIAAGINGVKLADPDGLKAQAAAAAKTVMNGSGLNFSTATAPQAFASLTPANFNKMLDVSVTKHIMYAYQGGQLINTFLVSAGAPITPTPLGTFHIWEKLPMQTMTGFNPNGSRYIQPNVPWINYFDHSGDAVHGNYWRPASVFGAVNTSHGCVSLPVNLAKWIYDWAPIGTTVIIHA